MATIGLKVRIKLSDESQALIDDLQTRVECVQNTLAKLQDSLNEVKLSFICETVKDDEPPETAEVSDGKKLKRASL